MKQRLLRCLTVVFLLATALPMIVGAVPVDTERTGSVTFYYHKDELLFPNLELRIYRVAQVHPDGTYTLLDPYSEYPVNIYGITSQEEWNQVTETLEAYLTADSVAPDYSVVTDEAGTALLSDLPTGMYLVLGQNAVAEGAIYTFNSYLVLMPRPNEDDTHNYELDVRPKSSILTSGSEISVTKLWRDTGSEMHRPASVTVDILRDGVLFQTVVLSEENNWNYHLVTDQQAQWTVVEREVPEGYTVTVTHQDYAFVVTNTYTDSPGDPPPDTGDIRNPWLYVVLMMLSGATLVILSQWKVRDRA